MEGHQNIQGDTKGKSSAHHFKFLTHVYKSWLETRVFPPDTTSAFHPASSPRPPPSLGDISLRTHSPPVSGRLQSMQGILESINEDGPQDTSPSLTRFLSDDNGVGSRPIDDVPNVPSYSDEHVQVSMGGTPVASDVAIAIQNLGVEGQADLVSLFICQYGVVLIGTVTRCTNSIKARPNGTYGIKATSGLRLSSQILRSASWRSYMSGRSNGTRCWQSDVTRRRRVSGERIQGKADTWQGRRWKRGSE